MLQNCNKNSDEFVAVLPERRNLFWSDDVCTDKELEPVGGFFQFPEGIATLSDNFGLAARAVRFAIVRADGCARTQDLFS